MPRRSKPKATANARPNAKPKIEVTLLKNGYVHGKLYRAGETVEVTPELKAFLTRTSPEVYQ